MTVELKSISTSENLQKVLSDAIKKRASYSEKAGLMAAKCCYSPCCCGAQGMGYKPAPCCPRAVKAPFVACVSRVVQCCVRTILCCGKCDQKTAQVHPQTGESPPLQVMDGDSID